MDPEEARGGPLSASQTQDSEGQSEPSGFIPSRNRVASSILPPAAFLAPKKPSQRTRSPASPTTPLTPQSFVTAKSPARKSSFGDDALPSPRGFDAGNSQIAPQTDQPAFVQSPYGSFAESAGDRLAGETANWEKQQTLPSKASTEPLLNVGNASSTGTGTPTGGANQDGAIGHSSDLSDSIAGIQDTLQDDDDGGEVDELGRRPHRVKRHGDDPLFDAIERAQGGGMKMNDQSYQPRNQVKIDRMLGSKADRVLGGATMQASTSFSASLAGASNRNRAGSHVDLEKAVHSASVSHGGIQPAPERNYKRHRGGNRFFLRGLIMTSSANPLPFLASLLATCVIPGLWFGFDASYVVHNISVAPVIILGYTFAVALTSMLVTAFRDPGVIPRDLDPDPPCTSGESLGALDPEDPLAVPLPRVIRVRGARDIRVKWCETCGTYRAPRSSHCRMCDNCVENIDHHCTFLNNCIGRRNYSSFFAFLIFTLVSCCIMIPFSILHLYYLTRPTDYALPKAGSFGGGLNFRQALANSPISAVMVILNVNVLPPIAMLLGYHAWLVVHNRTTVEQIRINTARDYGGQPVDAGGEEEKRCLFLPAKPGSRVHDPNPFSFGSSLRNLTAVLCRPVNDSWIARYDHALDDKRLDNPAWSTKASDNASHALSDVLEMQTRH